MPYLSQRVCRRATAIAVLAAVASLGTVVLMPGIAHATGTDTTVSRIKLATAVTVDATPASVPFGIKMSTEVIASATPASVPFGSASTLNGVVVSGAGYPTGIVTFLSGGATLCAILIPATSCTTPPTLAAGVYSILAAYSGDANYSSGIPTTITLTVTALTSFTASAAPPSVAVGSTSELSETGLPGDATGPVTFASGGMTLCVATLPATTCAYAAFLAAGEHAIIATYGGDSTYADSTATTMLTVTLLATSTKVRSSRNPAESGQAVVYTADVVSNPVSGTVSFTANGLPIAGCTAVGINPTSGTATCSTAYSSAGAHIIGATFSGNAGFAASSAATNGVLALTETVDAAVAVPTTGAGADGNPAQPLAGGVLALLGLLTVVEAKRRRSRS